MTSSLSKPTYFSPASCAGRHCRQPRQRMVRRTGQHHLLLPPGHDRQLAQPPRERHQAEVGRALQHSFVDPVGMQILELDLGVGVLGLKRSTYWPMSPRPTE